MRTGWECLTEQSGGTVAVLATGPTQDGHTLVFAGTPVGVYLSRDNGRAWRLAGGKNSVPLVEAIAVSPHYAQDHTMFVCGSDGLYRSSDGGQSWRQVLTGSRMLSVACARGQDSNRLVVLAGSETDGILRSDDDGRSWTGANAGLLDLSATAVALSPAFAYDRVGFVGTPSGLYRTRNGAQSWREVATEFADSAVQCVAFSPRFTEDHVLLAGTETDGLLRSDDGGSSWRRDTSLLAESVTAIAFAPGGTLAVATDSGVAVSRDVGASWSAWDMEGCQVLSLAWIDDALLAGTHRGGVLRSGGSGWSPANDGLSARIVTGLVVSPDFARDRTLFTIGVDDGVRASIDGGATWLEQSQGLDDTVVFGVTASPDFTRDHTLLAATSAGVYVSRDRAAHWEGCSATGGPVRLIATAARNRVFAAPEGGGLLASDDSGQTWHTLRAPFGTTELVALRALDQTVFVAARRATESVVWRSSDLGESWERWLVESASSAVVPLAVSPQYQVDELVFVGSGPRVLSPLRHTREIRSGERRPMWRDTNLDRAATVVLDLAVSKRTVYAATDSGVFVSRDAGATFQSWSEGLSERPVVALGVSPDDRLIFCVGLGGTLWRRHDNSA